MGVSFRRRLLSPSLELCSGKVDVHKAIALATGFPPVGHPHSFPWSGYESSFPPAVKICARI